MIRYSNDVPPGKRPLSFTTDVQAKAHCGERRRMLWSAAAVVAGLALLVLLGPDEQEIKDRFEYYGAPGELKIMQEISIEDGTHDVHQLPRSLMSSPPPSNMEIEKEKPTKNGTVDIPPVNIKNPNKIKTTNASPRTDSELSSDPQVRMARPMQSNPDYYILNLVYPEYPLDASEAERRMPIIFVNVNIFVGPDGIVTDAWANSTNGSDIFVEAGIKAAKQWKFGWRIDPGIGRSYVIPWQFRSPYFTSREIVR